MTLIDVSIYRAIRPHECLNQAYSRPGTRIVVAPEVVKMIERFNFVARMVTTVVMGCGTPRGRAEVLAHFIAVAKRCLEMRNFNSAHAVTSALTSASLHRLRRTWEKVPKRALSALKELRASFSASSNWSALRSLISASRTLPTVPWLGLHLRDLVLIEETQSPHLDTIHGSDTAPLVNFVRARNLCRVIEETLRYQKVDGYNFRVEEGVRRALEDEEGLLRSPTRQFEVSLKVEPREVGSVGMSDWVVALDLGQWLWSKES
ncbi:ras guanine nucleotide exchange factor domain-containing protein [Chytridium lagenaria]|nr:ras guanine nucleotide exchange factor domain-containing protein [Chytridium lagenaria]